ncbi:MAG: hypothetical protein JWQ04_257 [Pedosphaera sp.]|nr:hypothetical protein [Pedosphaera sp.]
MAPPAEPVEAWPRRVAWLRGFLKEELAPYPGRGALVARMVIAATLVMLITMTFRLPFGVQAVYALLISRETHWATVTAVRSAVIIFALATIYVLLGAIFSLGDPLLRMLWVVITLFLAFFAVSIIEDYTTALGFGILVTLAIPVLDRHISTELKVEETLWAAGQNMLAAIIAALAALFFAALKPGHFLVRLIAERLASVEDLLNCYAAGRPVDENKAKNITRLLMLGTSGLRRTLRRSGYPEHHAEQMGVVVTLVGSLVDLAGSLTALDVRVTEDDRRRIQTLIQNIARLRTGLLAGRTPQPGESPVDETIAQAMPLLPQMERTVAQIAEVFAGTQPLSAYAPLLSNEGEPPQQFFAHDALSNPEHIKFGLRGCLAASLCYILYTALDWPEISTAVVTCVLTALTTIGASRQKQALRFTGALAGGAIGVAAQAFVLPGVDSIAGFTLVFIMVTFAASWIATASPRLSYFGIQLALAYYFIHLQEFRIQTSLLPARDRVLGILIGLTMMWLVFDQLWTAPTVVEMRKAFISLFRLLAQLAREPVSDVQGVATERSYSLRETINSTFNQVRALADAVWFEFGASRQQDLALRRQIIGWQPQLRMLFITRVSLLKYCLQLPGFELPESVRLAQKEFDQSLAKALDGMADRLEGKPGETAEGLEALLARLKEIADTCESAQAPGLLDVHLRTFVPLLHRIEALAVSLNQEIFAPSDHP